MREWKEGAAKRRDARHTKLEPRPRSVTGSTKDTKRWCRGKPGKEHQLACFVDTTASWARTDADRPRRRCCKACGKEFATWYPNTWGNRPNPKPDWVDK